jgi:hypothetical protein
MKGIMKFMLPISISLFVTLISCKHEIEIGETNNCTSVTFPCEVLPSFGGSGWNVTYDSLTYSFPIFLPNSNTEFYVVKQNNRLRYASDLIKYNYVTKVETLISSRIPCLDQMAVNEDWICWTDYRDHKLYKLSTKGGSSIPVTKGNDWNDYPFFLSDKKTLVVTSADDNKSYKMDLDGNIGDTLRGDISYLACSKNNDLIGYWIKDSTFRTLVNYKLTSKIRTEIYDTKTRADVRIFSMCWHPNGKLFFYVNFYENLCSFNIETKEHKIIRPTCSSTRYLSVNVSPDGTKLICDMGITKPLSGQNVFVKAIVTVMNIDGSCEKQVLGL